MLFYANGIRVKFLRPNVAASVYVTVNTVGTGTHARVCKRASPWCRILVHAATGGVGLAAVHLLHSAGITTITGTASSPAKRALLRYAFPPSHSCGAGDEQTVHQPMCGDCLFQSSRRACRV